MGHKSVDICASLALSKAYHPPGERKTAYIGLSAVHEHSHEIVYRGERNALLYLPQRLARTMRAPRPWPLTTQPLCYFKPKHALLQVEADATSTRSRRYFDPKQTLFRPEAWHRNHAVTKPAPRSHNIATPFLPRPLALQPRRHGRADAVYWRLPQYDFILFTLL